MDWAIEGGQPVTFWPPRPAPSQPSCYTSRMSDTVEIKFRLEARGLTLETFGWTDLRDFLDLLAPALAAMEGGPTAQQLLPVRVEAGSAQPVVRVPRHSVGAVYRFRAGPTKTWTIEQRAKAGRVYDYLADREIALSCGARTLKPVEVPTDRANWRIREHVSLAGEVRRAGGDRGRVEIGFDEFGHTHCDAGRELAKKLGEHLYERVRATGLAERDARSGALVRFKVESFQVIDRLAFAEGLKELQDLLGDSMDEFDPQAFLREIRG